MARLHTIARRAAKRECRQAIRPDRDSGQTEPLNNPTALKEYWARQLEIAQDRLREAEQEDADSFHGRLPGSPHDSIQVAGWTRYDQGPAAFAPDDPEAQ